MRKRARVIPIPDRYLLIANAHFLVAMRAGEIPVLIPNTMVKPCTADGTMLETAWESRWLPGTWGISSVGRAPALQAGGHEFDSRILHSHVNREEEVPRSARETT